METVADREIASLPEPLQAGVALWFERLADKGGEIDDDLIAPLVRVVACSEFAAKTLLREYDYFQEHAAAWSSPPLDADLRSFAAGIADSDAGSAVVKSELRRYRNRYLLHVLWREVLGLSDFDETSYKLSLLADALLDAAARYAETQLQPRFGLVRNAAGERVPLVILGMGKLGGYELNFSSDIDIIFCYPDDGRSDGQRELSAQEYFARLSRLVIALLDEVTVDGFVFRIDTRLRPFGRSGPPVISFAALESYLLQHGRDWERYAYVKARIVGPQPGAAIADELSEDLIKPFVYRRYLDYGVFESVREMHSMIAAEVRRRELANNVKLGPGGIREAEFIVQALQLVRGGSEPKLQRRGFQAVLPLLVNARGVSERDAAGLRDAYRFLRRVENFIQGIRDAQTHDLPVAPIDRARLCLALGYSDWTNLDAELRRHRDAISAQFDIIAFRGRADENPGSEPFDRLFESQASIDQWSDALRPRAGEASRPLAEKIVAFRNSAALRKLDSVSRKRVQRFIPALMRVVVEQEHPVRVLSRVLAVSERILRRSAYLALLNENRHALVRLVELCRRSRYIAEQIARYPVLLDELLDPRTYADGVDRRQLADELQRRLQSENGVDSETRMQVIAEFQRASMFHIAVADFNEQLPIMKVSDGLTWLAEVVLESALEVAMGDLVASHGVPRYVSDGQTHTAGFGIVAYGKLGGLELSYGSDLDIVFLHDSHGDKQQTDGDRPLENAVFFARLVRRLVHFLTTQTGSGELYEIDTRLRPDGRSGLLVTSTEAFERYQEDNAWTWEHQALLRARAVAGSPQVAAEFERIRKETLAGRVHRDRLRDDVISMRGRMRKELDRSNSAQFDLKHGVGGIGDIEFLVQYLVLREAGRHAEVVVYSDNIRQLDALMRVDVIDAPTGLRLQDIYRDYRLYVHRRVLDGESALADSSRFVEEREFVTGAWNEWLDCGV